MGHKSKCPQEVRERAIRLGGERQSNYESEWAAISSIAKKIVCTPETVRKWIRNTQHKDGKRAPLPADERDRIRVLERENHELKSANEILLKASADFAVAELGLRPR